MVVAQTGFIVLYSYSPLVIVSVWPGYFSWYNVINEFQGIKL